MSIEDFLARLKGVTPDGKGGWMACCPAHDDKNPSMHVNVGDDGRILVKCFAGCSVDAIVAALGIEKRDLMPEKKLVGTERIKRGKRKAPPKVTAAAIIKPAADLKKDVKRDYGKLVAKYDYQDESGAVVFRVERRVKADGRKTFVQMHPDPNSRYGWSWGITKAGVVRVPYRLPRILAAAKAGKSVIICEGEKDVQTIEKRLGVAATCNPGGAGKWEAGWGKYFEGARSVLIIADKDPVTKPGKDGGEELFAVGQRHACDVERKLRDDGYAGEIKKIVMPDVVDEKVKDFTDWVQAVERSGGVANKESFKLVLDGWQGWPEEWNFTGVEADGEGITRAGKAARKSANSETAEMPGETDADGESAKFEEVGRYGRPAGSCPALPRSPAVEGREIVVDFDINRRWVGRFYVNEAGIRFEAWSEDDDKWYRVKTYSSVVCDSRQFVGVAIGCLLSLRMADFKVTNSVRVDLNCRLALAWLRARGRFFADKNNPSYETSMFFDEREGVLYRLHSNEFTSLLASAMDVNREDKAFKYMVALIDDFAIDERETPRVVPSKEWDRRGDVIYLSNGDSQMVKVSADKIETVANGTDDVLFVRGCTMAPWKVLEGPGQDPFKESLIFKLAALEKESDRMNCRLWFLNLFACHTNKPILLVTGPKGSGKTRLLQGMKQFLGLRDDGKLDDTVTDIDPSDKGLDSFWVVIDRGRFEIFDNFDTKVKWAENAFQTAATDGSQKRRELYKTTNVVTLWANAYIGITSNNPIFTTEGGGLPDRIITARICGGRKVSLGGELKRDIMEHRDEYMTWTVKVLAKVLADEKPVDASINRRHPDYGVFATKCGRAFGDEAGAILSMERAEIDKAMLPLMNHAVAKEVVQVLLMQEPRGTLKFFAGEMSDMIIKKIGEDDADEKTRTIYGSRRIGKAINTLEREFHELFKWDTAMVDGRTRYTFSGLTSQGEIVFAKSDSGLVGFNGQFPKTPIESAHAGEFSQNGTSNTLNPLHARAQVGDAFLANKGKDNGESSGVEDDGGGDDFVF